MPTGQHTPLARHRRRGGREGKAEKRKLFCTLHLALVAAELCHFHKPSPQSLTLCIHYQHMAPTKQDNRSWTATAEEATCHSFLWVQDARRPWQCSSALLLKNNNCIYTTTRIDTELELQTRSGWRQYRNRETHTTRSSHRQKLWRCQRTGYVAGMTWSPNTAFPQQNLRGTDTESGREVPAPCRELSGSQGGKVTLMGGMSVKLPQETGLQGAGKTSAGHRHLAPGEPLTSGKTLHSFVPNRQAGHSSSVPESNKQSSFKMLTYALFFLEKKAQNKRGGFA